MANKKKTNEALAGDFLDYLNAKFGTKDSDNDGICDEVEKMIGTDPYKFDTDGDGMGDGEEIRRGRNPLGKGSFKDFFVPHEGNNGHPHSLHPKRLMFYATSAVLVKSFAILFALSLPLTAWMSPDVFTKQTKRIVELTNELRSSVMVAPLAIDSKLEQGAYEKAEDMLMRQYFSHTGPDGKTLADWLKKVGYDYGVAGENLAVGFNSPEEVIEAWKESKTHYANMIDPDFSQIGIGMAAGNFDGEESLLAVQFFGYPQAVALPVHNQAAEQNTNQATVALSEQTMAEIKSMPLSEPKLLDPADKAVIKQGKTTLYLDAPGARELNLLVNDKERVLAIRMDARHFEAKVDLNNGLNKIVAIAADNEKSLRGDFSLVVDTEAPILIKTQSKIEIRKLPDGQMLVIAEAVSNGDAQSMILNFGNQRIAFGRQGNTNSWFAQAAFSKEQTKNIETITPAVVTIVDAVGNSADYDLPILGSNIRKVSGVKQYNFIRNNSNGAAGNLFNVSDGFLKFILLFNLIALSIAAFVGWKGMRKNVVWSTIGLCMLLTVLIII